MTPEKQMEKVEKLFSMISEEYVKPEELEEILVVLMGTIEKFKSELEQNMAKDKGEMETMHSKMYSELEEMESEVKNKLVKLEGKIEVKLDNTIKQIYSKIKDIESMIPSIPSFEPLERRIDEVESKIPQIPDEITPYQVRDKLESIDNESEKLKIVAVQKLREELDRIWEELSKKGGKSLFGGGFNYSAMDLHLKDDVTPTGDINDVNTVFSLPSTPSPASSLKVYLNGARQRLTVDYTLSGATITFTTAPQTDSVLLCDYRI